MLPYDPEISLLGICLTGNKCPQKNPQTNIRISIIHDEGRKTRLVDFYLVFLAFLSLFPCPLSILIRDPPGGFSPAHLLGRDFLYSWRQASVLWETQVPWNYNEDVALVTNRFHWVPCSKQPERWKVWLMPQKSKC